MIDNERIEEMMMELEEKCENTVRAERTLAFSID